MTHFRQIVTGVTGVPFYRVYARAHTPEIGRRVTRVTLPENRTVSLNLDKPPEKDYLDIFNQRGKVA